jgi:CBS domain-containing protein
MIKKSVETLLSEKKIYQIINDKLVRAEPTLAVVEAIRLMQDKKSGYIVIAHVKKVEGIFTEIDVAHKILGKDCDWQKPVREVMTKVPTVLTPKDSVSKAINVMSKHRIYHIPLVDEKSDLVGVLSVRTLIRFLAEFYPTEVYNLPPDPAQIMETPEGG